VAVLEDLFASLGVVDKVGKEVVVRTV
jgi:hypothetical protein